MARKGHVISEMARKGRTTAAGRRQHRQHRHGQHRQCMATRARHHQQHYIVGNCLSETQIWDFCELRFRQTPSGSTSTNKYEPLPTNWCVWNAISDLFRIRVSDKPRPCLSETFLRFRHTMFVWNANCLKRCPTKMRLTLSLQVFSLPELPLNYVMTAGFW